MSDITYMPQTLVYARLGRIEDAVQMLKAVIAEDTPDHVSAGSEIFQYIVSAEILQQ